MHLIDTKQYKLKVNVKLILSRIMNILRPPYFESKGFFRTLIFIFESLTLKTTFVLENMSLRRLRNVL